MSDHSNQESQSSYGMTYRIRIEGHLSPVWTETFEDFVITREADGETHLIGTIVDQAALHGVIKRIRDLGLTLIEIKRLTKSN